MTVEPKDYPHIKLTEANRARVDTTVSFSTGEQEWLDAGPGDECSYTDGRDNFHGAEVVQVVIVPDSNDELEARVTIRKT